MRWYAWYQGGNIHVADLDRSPADGSLLTMHVVVPLPADHRDWSEVYVAAVPDGEAVVYVACNAVRRLNLHGTVVWSYDLGSGGNEGAAVAVSPDADVVWVWASQMTDDGCDRLLVLDAASGGLLDQADLWSVGYGGGFFAHPDGTVIVSVGQGQCGPANFQARFDGGLLVVEELIGPLRDQRWLVALSPEGTRLVAFPDWAWGELLVHAWPGGELLTSFKAADLLPDQHRSDEPTFEWTTGFLNNGQLLTTIEVDQKALLVRVDLESGASSVIGEPFATPRGHTLGDGTWIAADEWKDRSGPRRLRRFQLDRSGEDLWPGLAGCAG
ncbi:hypothetical protein [Antribacter gilvus]|uniref:hypothetical protein n=1 Tax=Antribacter gilvus TaxID=2304675 RepID=UPI000F7BAA4D|nr:hypothetical protein [Antribacter gilvus]